MKTILATVLIVLNTVIAAHAQLTIALDSSFYSTGTFYHDYGFQDNLTDVKLQDDGKIVTVGTALSPAFAGNLLAVRLTTDGTFDTNFNGTGYITFPDFTESYAYECFIKADSTIVIAGTRADSNYQFATVVLRLKSDGTLDSTFGTNGFAIHELSTADDFAYAMVESPDHKILLAGTAIDTAFRNAPVVTRLLENGALDSTFGVNGVATLPIADLDNKLNSILLQPDGKIVVSGHYGLPITIDGQFNFDVLVARLNDDGSLDSTFDGDGLVTTAIFSDTQDTIRDYIEDAFGMQLADDGSIIVGGYTTLPDFSFDAILLKYDSTGTLDASFGTNGIVQFNNAIQDVAYDIKLDDDGNILVAGTSGGFFFDPRDFLLMRYLPDGNLDTTFAPNGYVLTSALGYFDEANALALQDDGKIVLAGKTNNGSNNDIAVARYHFTEVGTFLSHPTKSSGISVYPNPVSSSRQLSINLEQHKQESLKVSLYNQMGEILSEGMIEMNGTNAVMQLPAYLAQGLYLLKIEEQTIKIIVE